MVRFLLIQVLPDLFIVPRIGSIIHSRGYRLIFMNSVALLPPSLSLSSSFFFLPELFDHGNFAGS